MNLVGAEGRGESVWLGWFLCTVLESFAETIENRQPGRAVASSWRQRAGQLRAAIESVAWDGEWYLRAFFDNGTPLGSHTNEEARIDSLPQSWAVISGVGDRKRARQAMESAERPTWCANETGWCCCSTPPFDHSEPNPGLHHGLSARHCARTAGQYTHGSTWMAMAWARLCAKGAKARRGCCR
jgi:cyclic beta-1,2-glucan synthetase